MSYSDLFKEWRIADQAARIAEKVMLDEALLALEGLRDPPSSSETQQIKNLRERANELFQLAMAKMDKLMSNASPNLSPAPPPTAG